MYVKSGLEQEVWDGSFSVLCGLPHLPFPIPSYLSLRQVGLGIKQKAGDRRTDKPLPCHAYLLLYVPAPTCPTFPSCQLLPPPVPTAYLPPPHLHSMPLSAMHGLAAMSVALLRRGCCTCHILHLARTLRFLLGAQACFCSRDAFCHRITCFPNWRRAALPGCGEPYATRTADLQTHRARPRRTCAGVPRSICCVLYLRKMGRVRSIYQFRIYLRWRKFVRCPTACITFSPYFVAVPDI